MKLKRLLELFLLLMGILALIFGLFQDMGVKNTVLASIALILIAIFILIVEKGFRYQILPSKDEIGEWKTPLEHDFDQIFKLDTSVFSQSDLIPKEKFLQWFKVNKKIFTILYVGQKVVGYYSILPLRKPALNKFLQGNIREEGIRDEPDYIDKLKIE